MAAPDDDRPDRRLADSEGRALLQAIIETAPDALVAIDTGGIVRIFNPAAERLFGHAAEDILGQNIKVLMPPPYREQHDAYLARYLSTGEKRIIGIGRTVVGLRKSGATFPMELAVGEARFGDQRLFTGFVRDLSEIHKTQRRVHELQAELLQVAKLSAMAELASGLAHELNQPLTAIINYLQACRRLLADVDPARLDRVRELMDRAIAQTSRGGQVIQRLRRFIISGEPERSLGSINQVIEEACGLALVGIGDKGIHVDLELAGALPVVAVDKIQIHQVMINLIRNATDALVDVGGGAISIRTSTSGPGEVEITVADDGPGLAAEVAERLFQPFVTTKPEGMGIGLSICRTIVDAHGGQLWATTNQPRGTVFHITLPTADGQ